MLNQVIRRNDYNVINFHRPTRSQNISEFPCTMNLIIDCAARHAELFTGTLRWLGSRVVSVLDSGAERPWFKSQPQRCRVVTRQQTGKLGKLFTPIVPLFTKQQNW